MNNENNTKYSFELDDQPFQLAMLRLEDSTRRFGSLFASTMVGAVKNGKGFEDILKTLALRMSDLALSQAFKPLEGVLNSGMSKLFSGLSGGIASSLGGGGAVGAPINITPFAKGGVVGEPNYFSFGSRIGVMGERGNEAILPLARGPDGRLGVSAGGTGAGGATANAPNIVFNVATQDAAGFKKSEGQISAMLARAVSRGMRRI